MAIVDSITGENIERFRGIIDFYMLRGILPVARKWPKKPKPPYTALQAEAMAVFSLACSLMSRIGPNILTAWQIGAEGARAQWTDTFKGLTMQYWKLYKVLPLVALDYELIETATTFKVSWDVLQAFIDPLTPEILSTIETPIIDKIDLSNMVQPFYYTLLNDSGIRLIAPWILLKI